MAANVLPISVDPPAPKAAARLCNFKTGTAELLDEHKQWIDRTVGPVLANLPGTWVDLVGYASKLGSAASNKRLSERRIEAVKAYLTQLKKGINFQIATALGEERSLGDESNDDGYFRAVEVFVYGFQPPPLRYRVEEPKRVRHQFSIKLVTALSVSVAEFGADAVGFDIQEVSTGRWARFLYTGLNVGVSLGVKLPPVGWGGSGPKVPFTTGGPCVLEDFEGEATLFNAAGVALGPVSIGGEMGLSFESGKLRAKSVFVWPRVIKLTNDTGLSISFGSAGKGKLTLLPASVYR